MRRHETASTLITTNRPTQDWGIFLGDVPAATGNLDRFLAHATIVQVTGKSYRLRQRAVRPTTEAVDGAEAVDAKNAPTAAWKRADAFPTPPTAVLVTRTKNEDTIPRLRAGPESDDTHATYRVAAFQTFLSGCI